MTTFFPLPVVPPSGPSPWIAPLLEAFWRPIKPRVLARLKGSGVVVARRGRDDIVALFNARKVRPIEVGDDSLK